jgi:hypothetical protein
MAIKRCFGTALFCILIYIGPAHAQAPAGYTKIATTNGVSQVDTVVVAGQVTNYIVTVLYGTVESVPSNIVTATTPNTSVAHSNDLSWIAMPNATGYNVYRQVISGTTLTVTSQ